jgi:hypothetical protein
MLTMMLAQEIQADRLRQARGRTATACPLSGSLRVSVGWFLVTIGLRLASPRRGATTSLAGA